MVQHSSIDHTGLTGVSTVSYASNVNRVDVANVGGAASTMTRGDHVHLGVTSLSHTSNTFSGPVTLVAAGTLGITSPSTGTFALSSTGGAAAAGAAANLGAAGYTRTAGNYTTTSTSFVDVDGTNLALTITTGARRVMISLAGSGKIGDAAESMGFDVDLDGARIGGTDGIFQLAGDTVIRSVSFTWVTVPLTAASHTFKLQWKVSGGTGTLYGNSAGLQMRFAVTELYAG